MDFLFKLLDPYMAKVFGASWKTTVLGIASTVTAIGMLLTAILDGDPNTVPDWSIIGPLLGIGGIGLAARDNKVSSEDAGAK
jgi:hypothetical protein